MTERDAFAWPTLVSSHAGVGDTSSARNIATWNTMIDGYARLSNVESAELLFNHTPTKDTISWTTMIDCYSQHKKSGGQ
ncbi:PREDICTED: pentatricopeptide [Prunus dulcis]|uniref:PREDICTED: pentatricopeptide n=1 Tax=Prunus dulcis TaxID=3755 RepID=A0A5E4FFU3_PRUDU|nr:PREDICTED: pentatricopeptide [Prunus dulcis]